jgi:hypothetical protein
MIPLQMKETIKSKLISLRSKLSIGDIWQITFHLTMAKYLPMLPKDKMVQ